MMRSICELGHIATSQDGFIATENDGLDWLPQPNEVEDFGMKVFMNTVDCVVMGRRTWEVAQTLEENPFDGGIVQTTWVR